jgi:hypothetical protein
LKLLPFWLLAVSELPNETSKRNVRYQ